MYEASRRVVPVVTPLLMLLKRRVLEAGRPSNDLVCSPHASWATTGLLNTGWLATRADSYWSEADLRLSRFRKLDTPRRPGWMLPV